MKGQHCRETQSNVHRESVAFACFDRWWTPQHSAGHCCQRTSRLVWRRGLLWARLSGRWSPSCQCAPSTSFQLGRVRSRLWQGNSFYASYAWFSFLLIIANCDMRVTLQHCWTVCFGSHSPVKAMIHNMQVTQWKTAKVLLNAQCKIAHEWFRRF